MNKEIKVCFRCKKVIKDKEHYFIMVEMNNGKEIRRDYVHKTCWDTFINQLNTATDSLTKSNYLLNAMGNHMKKMGIIPEEKQEVIIQ